jgi:hypothetical protein
MQKHVLYQLHPYLYSPNIILSKILLSPLPFSFIKDK